MSLPSSEPAHSFERARWFAEVVQPFEPALRAYLRGRFPSLTDQDDIVQDTYTRLFRAREAGEIRHPKAFLFTTARNAALDFFRHQRVISVVDVTRFDESSVLTAQPDVAEQASRAQEFEFLADAMTTLPDRCRQVIMLRYYDALSYQEIATQLGVSIETVKTQMARGTRRCAEYFRERGLLKSNPPEGGASS